VTINWKAGFSKIGTATTFADFSLPKILTIVMVLPLWFSIFGRNDLLALYAPWNRHTEHNQPVSALSEFNTKRHVYPKNEFDDAHAPASIVQGSNQLAIKYEGIDDSIPGIDQINKMCYVCDTDPLLISSYFLQYHNDDSKLHEIPKFNGH
jgi:hypothetical protein